ncbi:MgtC/SapB family protein [bacterium]|nr:MgtC/SapB family protein [bacterium]
MVYQDFLLRIIVSFALSFAIGLERQWRRRVIGLRTNVLVCLGSFLFVSFSFLTNAYDVSRIASQVVCGIGFLGAGVILKDKGNIKGLDTAATLWCAAAIGTLCASGFLLEALVGTLFILLANVVLRGITRKLNLKHVEKMQFDKYRLKVVCSEEQEFLIRTLISQSTNKTEASLISIETTDLEDERIRITATFNVPKDATFLLEDLVNRIVIEKGIVSSGWKKITDTKNIDEILEEDI